MSRQLRKATCIMNGVERNTVTGNRVEGLGSFASNFSSTFLLFATLYFLSLPVLANVGVDFRTTSALTIKPNQASYSLLIQDCSQLTSIDIAAGSYAETFLPNDARHLGVSSLGCEIDFFGADGGYLTPQAVLHFQDSSTQTHIETFSTELIPPHLAYQAISLEMVAGVQYLSVQVEATDDVDISHVSFSVIGIRASDLRAAGGVIDKASKQAFADSGGVVRVYPQYEGQNLFDLKIPVNGFLSAEEIAHDGVVLLDVTAVDASGNQQSLSKIAFTGDDVVEQAQALQLLPSNISIASHHTVENVIMPYCRQ